MSTPSRNLAAPSRRDQRANAKALAFASKTRPRPALPSERSRSSDADPTDVAPVRPSRGSPIASGAPRATVGSARQNMAVAGTATSTPATSTRLSSTRAARPVTGANPLSVTAGTSAPRVSARRGPSGAGGLQSIGAAALAAPPRMRAVVDPTARRSDVHGRAATRLRVVARAPRNPRRVFAMLLVAVLTLMTVVIGFAAVAMHATLAQDQLVLDTNRVKVQQAERINQHLRVEVAELESPDRIVAVAASLGMKSPDEVTFMPAAGTGIQVPDAATQANAPRAGR